MPSAPSPRWKLRSAPVLNFSAANCIRGILVRLLRFGSLVYVALLFAFLFLGSAAGEGQAGSPSATTPPRPPLLRYSLPPGKLAEAHALYQLDATMVPVLAVWIVLVFYLMLRFRFGVRLRDLAVRASRFGIVQAVIVMSLFTAAFELTQLPFDVYQHHVGLSYGLSVQPWGSWFGDWGKSVALGCLLASLLGRILYAVLRRSPRRWWFYFWLALIPIVVLVLFVEPVWIEPMFNKFEPLSDHHADLVAQIERVVRRAGMDIPPDRMFEMKASEKRTTLNAYVTGFGSTKRVVVWDTTMEHMTTPETLFVFGHEMGHYVLGHIPKQVAITLLQLLVLFYIGYRLATWAVTNYGARWGIRSLEDWASIPLLTLILFALTFLATPAFNAVSRHYEHQADQYGSEVIHGLVPDAPLAAAHAFQVLGERSLDYPYVGKFMEFWAWDHPTIRDRMIFVQTYDPWGQGRQPEFVKSAP